MVPASARRETARWSGPPHSQQNDPSVGLGVLHSGQQRPSASSMRGENSKCGAAGRPEMVPSRGVSRTCVAALAWTVASAPLPNSLPQSRQYRMCSGLPRPQRSQSTARGERAATAKSTQCRSEFHFCRAGEDGPPVVTSVGGGHEAQPRAPERPGVRCRSPQKRRRAAARRCRSNREKRWADTRASHRWPAPG